MRFRASGAAAWLFTLLVCTYALAQEQVTLEVDAAVPVALAQRVESAIVGQLADLPASAERVTVRVASSQAELTLALFDRAGRPRGVRTLLVRSDEVAASEAASVVRSFVLAMRDEDASPPLTVEAVIAFEPEPEPVPAPEVVQAAPPPKVVVAASPLEESPRLWLTALYTGSTYANVFPWRNGGRGELAVRVWRSVFVGAGYALHAPLSFEDRPDAVRISSHGPSASFGAHHTVSRYSIGGDLGLGLSAMRYRRIWGTNSSIDRFWTVEVALRARIRIRVVSQLWLELAPALVRTTEEPVVRSGGQNPYPLLSLQPWRFRLDAGFTVELF